MVELDGFLAAIFGEVKDEVVCLVDARPDPKQGRTIFPARPWRPGRSRIQGGTYFCISTVKPVGQGEKLQRTLSHVVKTYVVVLDDIGTKIPADIFAGKAEPHYVLETSPGNFQWGYFIEPSDPDDAAALIHALAIADVFDTDKDDGEGKPITGGWTDKGAQGKNRVVRVPGSINSKHGQKFAAKLHQWHPEEPRWTLQELAAEFGVTPVADAGGSSVDRPNRAGETEDPVFNWLRDQGHVLGPPNADGYASIICPWADEHTDPRSDARWALGVGLTGAFKCFHAACHERHTHDILDWIEDTGGPDFSTAEAEQVSAVGAKLLRHAAKSGAGVRGRPTAAAAADRRTEEIGRQNEPPGRLEAVGPAGEAPEIAGLLAAILDGLPWLQRENLPTVERTAGGGIKAEQKPTAENVGWVALNAGFLVQKNELSGEIEIDLAEPKLDVFTAPQDRARLTRELLLSTCQRVGINARSVVQTSLEALATGNGYHPLVDWATSVPWRGEDHIAELAATIGAVDPRWCEIAVRRWCVQAAVAWTNWQRVQPVSVPHVLVLQGPQGLGKTSWFRRLLPEGQVQVEASLHLDSMRADDQKRKVLSSPIVELGELETTLGRSENGALRSFLSNTSDRYRLPYDRDITIRTRCTGFGASVNDPEFLLDPWGARRFWTVSLTSINFRHSIDLQQLWAQAFALMNAGEQWNLVGTPEIALHAASAEKHRVISYAESLLGELAARRETIDEGEWAFASAAEIGKYYKLENNVSSWRTVGRTLREMFGEMRSSNGKKGWIVPIRKHEFTSGYIPYNAPPKLRVVK